MKVFITIHSVAMTELVSEFFVVHSFYANFLQNYKLRQFSLKLLPNAIKPPT